MISSKILALFKRLAVSRKNSVWVGSYGTGKSIPPERRGRLCKSLADNCRTFRDAVTTVSRVPDLRVAVAMMAPRPRRTDDSKRTTSPGLRPRRAISSSVAEIEIGRASSMSSKTPVAVLDSSSAASFLLCKFASDKTTSLSV